MASNSSTSFVGILARLFWMMAGPAALLLLAYTLAENQKGWFAPSSIAFLVVLAVVVITRWLDPLTSEGEPVTHAHLRRYTLIVLGIGLTAWAVANLIGNHWLATAVTTPG
jgi:hypothetical protein